MMSILSVLLIILKYIGIVLGIILCILLSILCIILFVPFRYSVDFSGVKSLDMDIKITWFRKLVFYHFAMRNSKKTTKIFRFFGRDLLKEEKVQEEPRQTKDSKKKSVESKKDSKENTYINNTHNTINHTVEKQEKKIENTSNVIEYHKEEAKEVTAVKDKVESFKKDLSQEVEEQVEEKNTFGIKDILKYPNKKGILFYTYEFIKKLILHIIPREFYCKVEFGLDDPADTGYVLGAVGIIQPYFGNSVNIKGNFQEKVFSGEVHGKGKFLLGIIIKYIIQYLFKKPIRQIVMLYFKKRKEDNNGIEFEE